MKSRSVSDLAIYAVVAAVLALNVAAFANASLGRNAGFQEDLVEWNPIDYGHSAAEIVVNFVFGTLLTAPLATVLIRSNTKARSKRSLERWLSRS